MKPGDSINSGVTGPAARLPACILCGTARARKIVEQPAARYFARTIYTCDACSLAFVHPQPSDEELARVYSSTTYFEQHSDTPEKQPGQERADVRVGILSKFLRGNPALAERRPRVLDIGPGTGEFMRTVSAAGWSAQGLEATAEWAKSLARQTGLRVDASWSLAAFEDPEPFDVISMWEVIEHYRDPLAEVTGARRRLKPGGWLAISTPNLGSFRGRVYGPRWRGFTEGFEHLFFFSPRSLRAVLERAGFQEIRLRTWKINSALLKPLEWAGMGNVLEAYARA